MAVTVGQVMTADPVLVTSVTTIAQAAARMREADVGDVVVVSSQDGDQVVGILTDRDIVTRVVAEGNDRSTPVGQVCSERGLITVAPEAAVADVLELMRSEAVRRIPVVDGGTVLGVVSLGDLAGECDPESVLADISATAANR